MRKLGWRNNFRLYSFWFFLGFSSGSIVIKIARLSSPLPSRLTDLLNVKTTPPARLAYDRSLQGGHARAYCVTPFFSLFSSSVIFFLYRPSL